LSSSAENPYSAEVGSPVATVDIGGSAKNAR
jgi:hypothetical protein